MSTGPREFCNATNTLFGVILPAHEEGNMLATVETGSPAFTEWRFDIAIL